MDCGQAYSLACTQTREVETPPSRPPSLALHFFPMGCELQTRTKGQPPRKRRRKGPGRTCKGGWGRGGVLPRWSYFWAKSPSIGSCLQGGFRDDRLGAGKRKSEWLAIFESVTGVACFPFFSWDVSLFFLLPSFFFCYTRALAFENSASLLPWFYDNNEKSRFL